jgi:hypothetical protein
MQKLTPVPEGDEMGPADEVDDHHRNLLYFESKSMKDLWS